jgi:hypothetical protein
MGKILWIENDSRVDDFYLQCAKQQRINLRDVDFLYRLQYIDKMEAFEKIVSYKKIVSCSVYTGASFFQLTSFLAMIGRNNISGITYYSLTGEFLTDSLNLGMDSLKNPVSVLSIIKAVTNNKIYECSYKGKFRVVFNPGIGRFGTVKLK